MLGLAILLLFQVLGMIVERLLPVGVPANVMGMMLLLAALMTGAVRREWVEETADFLLRHMMLFFAPVIIGVLPLAPVLQQNLLPVSGGLVASTVVTMAAAGWFAQCTMKSEGAAGER